MVSEYFVILFWQVYSGEHEEERRVETRGLRIQHADGLRSIFSSTRRETGDQPYSAQHCCAGRKWCDTSHLY